MSNLYDDHAAEYAEWVSQNEQEPDPFLPFLLDTLGEVAGLKILDAGCGEGYLSRILAQKSAHTTGIDVSPRLIETARSKAFADVIDYRVADLSQPLPDMGEYFDAAVSYFVLNDVPDYQGFIATLAGVVKPNGSVVVGMNNPYSFVVRNHLNNYFASGEAFIYPGLAERGIKVHFYQRTLAEYLDAFLLQFRLLRLVDVPTPEFILSKKTKSLLPPGYQFPYFLVLSFEKK